MILTSTCFVLQASKTDCNHIFLNFVPTLTLTDPAKVRCNINKCCFPFLSKFTLCWRYYNHALRQVANLFNKVILCVQIHTTMFVQVYANPSLVNRLWIFRNMRSGVMSIFTHPLPNVSINYHQQTSNLSFVFEMRGICLRLYQLSITN